MNFLGRDKAFMERITTDKEANNGSILAAIGDYWSVDTDTSRKILDCWNDQHPSTVFTPSVPTSEFTIPDLTPLSTTPKTIRFADLANRLVTTYCRKNADYGDSFGRSVEKYGIVAALTRMSDKWNRLENLILKGGKSEVADESVLDTLLDLAAYSLMTYMEVEDGAKRRDKV